MFESFPNKTGANAGGHETRDINPRAVAWFGAGVAIMLLVILSVVGWLLSAIGTQHSTGPAVIQLNGQRILPPEPRLQSDPAGDLARFRERENATLNGYGWVDRPAGVVRIPVERAMDIIAQRGLPVLPVSSGRTPLQMRQEKANSEKLSP